MQVLYDIDPVDWLGNPLQPKKHKKHRLEPKQLIINQTSMGFGGGRVSFGRVGGVP